MLWTHADKVPDARPEAVVWELAPPTGVGDSAVVKDAPQGIHEHRDEEDDAENTAGTHAPWLVWLGMATSVDRSSLEKVRAIVGGIHEGDGCLRVAGVQIAVEGDGSGLALHWCLVVTLFHRLDFMGLSLCTSGAALGCGPALLLGLRGAGRASCVLQEELTPPAGELHRGRSATVSIP